jgi:hypothetical protein
LIPPPIYEANEVDDAAPSFRGRLDPEDRSNMHTISATINNSRELRMRDSARESPANWPTLEAAAARCFHSASRLTKGEGTSGDSVPPSFS